MEAKGGEKGVAENARKANEGYDDDGQKR